MSNKVHRIDWEEVRRATAYHEAAHAVMACYGGRKDLGTITIIAAGDSLGQCIWLSEVMRAEDSLRNMIAGAVAEHRVGSPYGIDQFIEEAQSYSDLEIDEWEYEYGLDDGEPVPDIVAFLRTLRQPGFLESWFWGKSEEDAIRSLWRTTDEYLGGSWGAVEAIATELLEHGTIDGQVARDIVGQHDEQFR